ncbi:MAG TPA: hypothetical protein VNT79_01310 [Phycisphaerae bacterium]|nr:hypothetical protein [Phycisphaerae bacterium]
MAATPHIRHALEASLARHRQVKHLLEIVKGLNGDVIIAGDFNTPIWMPEYPLMRAAHDAAEQPGDSNRLHLREREHRRDALRSAEL